MPITTYSARLGPGGRIVLPAALRRRLNLTTGSELILAETREGYLIQTRADAIRRAQELVSKHGRPGVSLADELIQDRRREAREASRNRP